MDFIEDAQNHPDRIDNVRLEPLNQRSLFCADTGEHDKCKPSQFACTCSCHRPPLEPAKCNHPYTETIENCWTEERNNDGLNCLQCEQCKQLVEIESTCDVHSELLNQRSFAPAPTVNPSAGIGPTPMLTDEQLETWRAWRRAVDLIAAEGVRIDQHPKLADALEAWAMAYAEASR